MDWKKLLAGLVIYRAGRSSGKSERDRGAYVPQRKYGVPDMKVWMLVWFVIGLAIVLLIGR